MSTRRTGRSASAPSRTRSNAPGSRTRKRGRVNSVSYIEQLQPFPDVPEALGRLQRRLKIVVLSNGDPDMLEAAKQYHRIPFDAVISVA